MYFIYTRLINKETHAKYPDEYKDRYIRFYYLPYRATQKRFKLAIECDDEKLKSYGAKGLFWFNCIYLSFIIFMLAIVTLVLFAVLFS
jgi:hypothetical protein